MNKHFMGCEAHLAWKFLFTRAFLRRAILTRQVGQTGLFLRAIMVHYLVCACKITILCVQRLRVVQPWLTSRHIHTQTASWQAYIITDADRYL